MSGAWITIGRATTHGQALPLGSDDPLPAARAVRRALADAGRKAVDVEVLVLAMADPPPATVLRAFARRALGPHGEAVRMGCVNGDASEADALSALAADELATLEGFAAGVGVAIGIAPDGTSVARCVGHA